MVTVLIIASVGCSGGGSGGSDDGQSLDGVFVKPTGTDGVGCGTSWDTACASVQAGSDAAVASAKTSVFVAAGTYRAAAANATVLTMADGISYLGGFAGNETTLASRNPQANPTILDGDVNNNDPTRSDNSRHVVVGANNATLDGFRVQGGVAVNADPRGAGMLNDTLTNLTVSSVEFLQNRVLAGASAFGGGMHNEDVTGLTVSDVVFDGNIISASVTGQGAGFYASNSEPVLSGLTVENNAIAGNPNAPSGGGLYVTGSGLTLSDSVIENNQVVDGNGGGLSAQPSAAMSLTDVTFTLNEVEQSGQGGALYVMASGGAVPVTLNRVTFDTNDLWYGSGAGMYLESGTASLTDVTFEDNGLTLGYGGGLAARNTTLTVIDTAFDNNDISSYSGGGGLWSRDSTTTLTNVSFRDNDVGTFGSSANFGGGLLARNGSVTMSHVQFDGNSVAGSYAYGGGVFLNAAALTATDVQFVENSVSASRTGSGAGIGADTAATTLTNVAFASNFAYGGSAVDGGAMRAGGTQVHTLNNVTFYDNVDSSSAASGAGSALSINGTTITGNNLLWADNAGAAFDFSGAATITSSCADESLAAIGGATVLGATLAAGNVITAAASGQPFLDQGSNCVDTGVNATATAAFAPVDWADLTTALDGTLDSTPVDPGAHSDPAADLWIRTASISGANLNFDVNAPAGTVCTYQEIAPGTSAVIPITSAQLAAGTLAHGLGAPTNINLTCALDPIEVFAIASI